MTQLGSTGASATSKAEYVRSPLLPFSISLFYILAIRCRLEFKRRIQACSNLPDTFGPSQTARGVCRRLSSRSGFVGRTRRADPCLLCRSSTSVRKVRVGELELDYANQKVTRTRIERRPKEFAILEYLMRNAGRPVTRSMIVETLGAGSSKGYGLGYELDRIEKSA